MTDEFTEKARQNFEKLYNKKEELNPSSRLETVLIELDESIKTLIKYDECVYRLLLKVLDESKKNNQEKFWFLFWIGFHSCWMGVLFCNVIMWFLDPIKQWILNLY